MIHLLFSIISMTGFTISALAAAPTGPETVASVDLGKYAGRWYQISRNPLPFEAGCTCSQQTLTPNTDGTIAVYNSCNLGNPRGALSEIRGTATSDDPVGNSKFIVDFGLPRKGSYWIIGLGANYEYAVVTDKDSNSLYILSKTPTLSSSLYHEALTKAQTQVDITKLQLTEQKSCQYPPGFTVAPPAPPNSPLEKEHPGSKTYTHQLREESFQCQGREVQVLLPDGISTGQPSPVVVYGHGQALGFEEYRGTFEHLAKKGVAVVFPEYSNGFFDQDWQRMGKDYLTLTDCALARFSAELDASRVVFSGHSKGAYIATQAAGLQGQYPGVQAKAVLVFQTAGVDENVIKNIPSDVALTVVYSDQDTIVSKQFSETLFQKAGSTLRQFIEVKSYTQTSPALKADHMWPLTKKTLFGGGPESSLHYYGAWKWLVAAAIDLTDSSDFDQQYLYSDLAVDKGIVGFTDTVQRSW